MLNYGKKTDLSEAHAGCGKMRQFKCVSLACNNVMYSDSNPKDICSKCNELIRIGFEESISGDMMRDE